MWQHAPVRLIVLFGCMVRQQPAADRLTKDMNAVLGALLLGDELEVDDRISDMDADETTVVLGSV